MSLVLVAIIHNSKYSYKHYTRLALLITPSYTVFFYFLTKYH